VNDSSAEQDALTSTVARLQSELQRMESRYQRLESQVHDLAIGYAMNNQTALQLTIDALKRLEGLEARFGAADRRPYRPQKRPQRDAGARRKAA
jgi:cell division protein FtsB